MSKNNDPFDMWNTRSPFFNPSQAMRQGAIFPSADEVEIGVRFFAILLGVPAAIIAVLAVLAVGAVGLICLTQWLLGG